MNKTLFILFIFLIAVSTGLSQTNTISVGSSLIFDFPQTLNIKNQKNQNITLQSDKNVKAAILKTAQAEALFNGGYSNIRINDFPVSPTENKTVILNKSASVFTDDVQFYQGTSKGKLPMPKVNLNSYYGSIENVEDSRIYLNYVDGMLLYIVENNGQNYNFTPILQNGSFDIPHVLSAPHSAVKDGGNPFVCLTNDNTGLNVEVPEPGKHNEDFLAASKLLEAQIICEGTYEYYTLLGKNYDRAAAYMASVIAVSSKIYENDLNVRLTIKDILIWTDNQSDPYINDLMLTDKLQTMPGLWSSSSTKRTLVVLFANLGAQPPTTQVAGISMGGTPKVGSLCSNTNGYCVFGIKADGFSVYPTVNYTWDVNCAAHEMGHNFSSPHTHNCYFLPQIDTCITIGNPLPESDACQNGKPIPRRGTLMSYCHLTNQGSYVDLVFHPRCVQIMRIAAEVSTCVKAPTVPVLKLLNPLGEESYNAGQTEQIRWVYSNVTSIGIKFSSNNGSSWNVVKENVAVTDSIYSWTIPAVATTQGKIWIYSMSNASVGDTSWKPFSIVSASISITKPVQGGRYSQKAPLSVLWTASLIPSVNIEFSTDAGSSWNTLATSQTSGQYSWDISKISSENCKLRISSTDKTISAETGIFAIGAETASVIYPQGIEVWCGGYNYYINWKSDFVDQLFVEYTTDAGTTWKSVRSVPTPFPAGTNFYNWKLPAVSTKVTDAKIRLYSSTDKSTILAVSKDFTIDTCVKSSVTDLPGESGNSPLQIVEITPNPASKNIRITLSNNIGVSTNFSLSLFDEKGAMVSSLGSYNITNTGNQSFDVTLPVIGNGTYFITAVTGNYRSSSKVQINK